MIGRMQQASGVLVMAHLLTWCQIYCDHSLLMLDEAVILKSFF